MMSREDKTQLVSDLREKINSSSGVFLTNLIGLSANDSVSLRKEIREAGGSVTVTRNTLFRLAAEGTNAEDALKNLKGPHALAFASSDVAAVAKCLKEAGKNSEDLVSLEAGFLDGKLLSSEELTTLANLPGKDQMLATLLATFNAPIGAFARVLNAIKEQKESPEAETVE
ncbi:MAG: 50S ribosomal protein L10 [Halobacteriovoraceae bacterium]|nr:50S ribosomal protein L10 [Halobacteriovoraceae bacterium]